LLSALMITSIVALALPLLSTGTAHATLTMHDSIYINGNDNFTLANGVTSGSGTENDPYIIENWAIGASINNQIEISSTSAYFIIRNCLVENGLGIHFHNATNGGIDNIAVNNDFGIYLYQSDDAVISNNIVKDSSSYGIALGYSNNATISNNTVSNNHASDGIELNYSNNATIDNNTVSNNSSDGIFLFYSNNATIDNNTVSNNSAGISPVASNNATIDNNTCSNNRYGILLSQLDNATVSNNIVKDSSSYGIYQFSSNNNRVFHNNLINNATQAFAYDTTSNFLDNGYPSGGNYWSDYAGVDENHGENQNILGGDEIGDTPYYISGGSNQDRYPLIDPWPVARLGFATFGLENLYKVSLTENLQLYDGSVLGVEFDKYDNITYQDFSFIEIITPPQSVVENENIPHPRAAERFSWGTVQIAKFILADSDGNVISIIATFTAHQSDLRGRYMVILRAWSSNPPQQPAFRAELIDVLRQWSGAPV
jgi:parallel beta-helix repeat protein